MPGSTREYWKLFYRYAKYFPIWRDLTFSFHGDIGYGDAYDDYDDTSLAHPIGDPIINLSFAGQCLQQEVISIDRGLPFYEHFYGGGVKDIRGFDDNTLGPKDPFCRSLGGDLKVSGGFELAIPTPFTSGSGCPSANSRTTGCLSAAASSAAAAVCCASIAVVWRFALTCIRNSSVRRFNSINERASIPCCAFDRPVRTS